MEPTRRPRVAVVGLGPFGIEHLRQYRHLGVEVIAVTDRDRDLGQRIGRCHHLQTVDTVDEVIGLGPDAVSLVTGPAGNAELLPVLVAAGIPVLVEKPFAATVTDAEALAALPDAERLIHPGHVLRHDAGCRHLVDLVSAGAVGRVVAVDAERHRGTDHQRYRHHHTIASLTMYHDVDLAHWITGATPVQIDAASADDGARLSAVVHDDRGATWTLRASWTLPPDTETERLVVSGTRGSVLLEDGAVVLDNEDGVHRHRVGGDPLLAEIAEFCRVVAGAEAPSRVTVGDAVACVRTVAAIEEGITP